MIRSQNRLACRSHGSLQSFCCIARRFLFEVSCPFSQRKNVPNWSGIRYDTYSRCTFLRCATCFLLRWSTRSHFSLSENIVGKIDTTCSQSRSLDVCPQATYFFVCTTFKAISSWSYLSHCTHLPLNLSTSYDKSNDLAPSIISSGAVPKTVWYIYSVTAKALQSAALGHYVYWGHSPSSNCNPT